jgi:MarR family 2-MHQ and catechol resistance regulon transcriptional repressor
MGTMTTNTIELQPDRLQDNRNLAVLTWVRLMRVYHKVDRRTAEEMKRWKLSVSRFDILNHAGVREGRPQQELADALLVTKGNICQLLDGMEADGLLRRRRSGRTNHIYLTDEGRALREASMARHEECIAQGMSALTPDEQQTLLTLLRKLDRSLSNHPDY